MNKVMQAVQGLKNQVSRFVKEEDGLGIVEIVLILVIILALAIIFKNQIQDIVENALQTFETGVNRFTAQ